MHHCCTFPGHNGPTCGGGGVDYLVLLCQCVFSILIRKLMIVDAVEV